MPSDIHKRLTYEDSFRDSPRGCWKTHDHSITPGAYRSSQGLSALPSSSSSSPTTNAESQLYILTAHVKLVLSHQLARLRRHLRRHQNLIATPIHPHLPRPSTPPHLFCRGVSCGAAGKQYIHDRLPAVLPVELYMG